MARKHQETLHQYKERIIDPIVSHTVPPSGTMLLSGWDMDKLRVVITHRDIGFL